MAVPIYTGSVSVPSLGFFSSATSVTGSFAGAVTAGPNPYGFVSIGDINASRSATTGAIIIGGVTERSVFDYGLTNAHTSTLQGIGPSSTSNLVVQGTIKAAQSAGGTTGFVPPGYQRNGTSVVSTFHVITDNIVAGGSSTTVTLSGQAAFTSASLYIVIVEDASNPGVFIAVTGKTLNSFTFASTNGHTYVFIAMGW